MSCSLCRRPMDYVHGHAACLDSRCPMFGRNQAECCGGETADQCPVSTSELAQAGPAVRESVGRDLTARD